MNNQQSAEPNRSGLNQNGQTERPAALEVITETVADTISEAPNGETANFTVKTEQLVETVTVVDPNSEIVPDEEQADDYVSDEDLNKYESANESEYVPEKFVANPDLIVQMHQVNKFFGTKHVVKDFNLELKPFEFLAIAGPSGVGKSTILNMIGLLERADSGSIYLFGKPSPNINSGSGRSLLRTKISYLFQNAALIDHDNVEQNLKLAQTYSSTPKKDQAQERLDALETVGLDISLKQKIYELSGGEQQRLALAQILLRPNPLILADEPTGSLDVSNRDEVLKILEKLHDHQKTLVVVTHDPVVYERADRVIKLSFPEPTDSQS